jgi:hypothetical protein
MRRDVIFNSIKGLGKLLGAGDAMEVTIIGGAAGLLIGALPKVVTTTDVDIIGLRPSKATDEVLTAANDLATKEGIARGWLSVEAGLFAQAMPEGWKKRRKEIGKFGRLAVYAISRRDFIAMKFYAHRTVDLSHLERLKITAGEKLHTKKFLQGLRKKLPQERSKVEKAQAILEVWK